MLHGILGKNKILFCCLPIQPSGANDRRKNFFCHKKSCRVSWLKKTGTRLAIRIIRVCTYIRISEIWIGSPSSPRKFIWSAVLVLASLSPTAPLSLAMTMRFYYFSSIQPLIALRTQPQNGTEC